MSQPVHGCLRFCFDLSECANCRSVVPTYTIGEACDAGPITCREKTALILAWESHNRASVDYLLLFTGVAFSSVASKSLALSGTGTALWKTIALALTSLP
jgi:hypothetical protein